MWYVKLFTPYFFIIHLFMTDKQLLDAIIEDKYKTIKLMAEEKFGEENVEFKLPESISNFTSLDSYYNHINHVSDSYRLMDIIIYFPFKIVTCNETGESHKVEELYCKLTLLKNNTFEIYTARSKYTTAEINSNYTHSHVSGISSPYRIWLTTCLGTDATPLNILKYKQNKDDLDWMDIFNEIDRFYEVESLSGVPYRRLANITDFRNTDNYKQKITFYGDYQNLCLYDNDFKDFVDFVAKRLINQKTLLSNIDGEFMLNDSFNTFKLWLTNLIVEYLANVEFSVDDDTYKNIRKKFDNVLTPNVKTPTGSYVTISKKIFNANSKEFLFYFKGKSVYKRVVKTDNCEIFLMPDKDFQIYVQLKLLIIFNYEKFRTTDTAETIKVIV